MKKFVSFLTAAAISLLSAVIPVVADDEYEMIVKIGDVSAVRGEKEVVLPLEFIENKGFNSFIVRLTAKGGIDLAGYTVNTENFDGQSMSNGNTLLLDAKGADTNFSKGIVADVKMDISKVKYPGRYDVSYYFTDSKTMVINADGEELKTNWIDGSITVNGNANDIAMSEMFGDMDGNGEINSYDALILLENVVGCHDLSAKEVIKGDVNFDGEITANDALNLLQKTTKTITDFSGASYVGVYLDSSGKNVLNTVYYKDDKGNVL